MLAVNAIICDVNKKQLKTLNAIFAKPTLPSVVFADIEALIISLGGAIQERDGSRIKSHSMKSVGVGIAIVRTPVKKLNVIKLKRLVIYLTE